MSPRANIKTPKAFRLLGSIFLPPLALHVWLNHWGWGVLIIYYEGGRLGSLLVMRCGYRRILSIDNNREYDAF